MSPMDFKTICDEVAETYGVPGYSEMQIKRLFIQAAHCSMAELRQAVDLMALSEMRFPNIAQFLGYLRPYIFDAAKRKRAEIIAKDGACEVCHGSGMVIVTKHNDPLKHESTMRCGECRIADVIGVLRHVPAYVSIESKGIEPLIFEKSLNANPTRGRIDEIKKMLPADRAELLGREPWLKWPLALYGNRAIPVEPVNKPKSNWWQDE